MVRAFLDANVLFSAAYREDAGVRRLWGMERVVLISSTYAVEEARRNLRDPGMLRALEELVGLMEVVQVGSWPPELLGVLVLPPRGFSTTRAGARDLGLDRTSIRVDN